MSLLLELQPGIGSLEYSISDDDGLDDDDGFLEMPLRRRKARRERSKRRVVAVFGENGDQIYSALEDGGEDF
jgi:hypothetical protein